MPTGKNTPFNITFLAVLLCLTLFVDSPQMQGASIMSPWLNKLACHFFHANIWHFAANALCLAIMRPSPKDVVMSFPYAVMATFFTTEPIIGISGVLYAYMGMNIMRWRISMIDWVTFILANAFSVFIPGIAFGVHLAAFLFGIAHWYIDKQLNIIIESFERR